MALGKSVEPVGVLVANVVVTFVETLLGTLAASVISGNQLDKLSVGAAVGIAASVVWNTVLKPFAKSNGWMKS